MKKYANLIVTAFFIAAAFYMPSTVMADSGSLIWGKWKFIGYIYGGQFQDPPNPNLVLTFEFRQDGTDTLHWHRTNEVGFCERYGQFTYDGKELTDEITSVHPGNAFECYHDPDMMVGQTHTTPLRNDNDRLYMDLPLSDQTLVYVWAKQPDLFQRNRFPILE